MEGYFLSRLRRERSLQHEIVDFGLRSNPGSHPPTMLRIKNLAIPARGIAKFLCGTRGGIRTPDTRFRRPVLYPAELRVLARASTIVIATLWEASFFLDRQSSWRIIWSGSRN